MLIKGEGRAIDRSICLMFKEDIKHGPICVTYELVSIFFLWMCSYKHDDKRTTFFDFLTYIIFAYKTTFEIDISLFLLLLTSFLIHRVLLRF